jgi:hypothetical protein
MWVRMISAHLRNNSQIKPSLLEDNVFRQEALMWYVCFGGV